MRAAVKTKKIAQTQPAAPQTLRRILGVRGGWNLTYRLAKELTWGYAKPSSKCNHEGAGFGIAESISGFID